MCIFENTLNSLIKVLFLLSPTQCLEKLAKSLIFSILKIRKYLNSVPSNFELEVVGSNLGKSIILRRKVPGTNPTESTSFEV